MISKDFEFLKGMHPDDDCFLGSKMPLEMSHRLYTVAI